jgi:hypothetical protein
VERLLRLLKRFFHQNFSIKRRLQLSTDFHNDPNFIAFYLAYVLPRRGHYLNASQRLILQLKVWTVSSFILFHDHYLGNLRLQDINESTFPFYTTDFKHVDNFRQLERNGWHAIDVLGDGNCGYYSFLLGLQNVDDTTNFYIDTSKDAPKECLRRWRMNSLSLRERLQGASRDLLTTVWPPGHAGRSLEWWYIDIGAPFDEDKDALTDAFVIPKSPKIEKYFGKKFKDDPDLHFYHMDPYWGPMCVAYTFKVRVVVITRNCRPVEKDKAKAKAKAKAGKSDNYDDPNAIDYEDPDLIDVDSNGKHFYSTKIIEFPENFPEQAETYNPITYHNGIYRLSDAEYRSKKTIEILFMTGFSAPDPKDPTQRPKNSTRHFLFLRRVLCHGISNDYTWNEDETLEQFIELHGKSRTPVAGSLPTNPQAFATQPIHSPVVTLPNNSNEPTAPVAGTSLPTNLQATAATQPIHSPVTLPNNSNEPTALEVANTTPTVPTGKQFPPPKGKRGKAVKEKKKATKTVTKKKQQTKAKKKTQPAKVVITNVPRDQDANEKEEENEGSVSNLDNYDYMFDSKSEKFYRGVFCNSIKS